MPVEPSAEEELRFAALGARLLEGIGADGWEDRIAVCREFKKEIVTLLLGLHRAGVIGRTDIHPAPPDICDVCDRSLCDRLGFVEGIRSSTGWSRMCFDCFFANGESVHCDEGRLYSRYGDVWQCIGGGDVGLPRWRIMGGSEQLNLTASGSRDAALERHASKKIADLNLSVRTLSCLADAGIVTVADLVRKSPDELMLLPLFGRKSLDEITAFLAQLGLELECRKAAGES